MRIKKGDTVLIISGKDRGKKGAILQVFPKQAKVMVGGINLRKKHQKPKKTGEKGQIITLPTPISLSNVKFICSKCGKPTRVGYKFVESKKYRTGEEDKSSSSPFANARVGVEDKSSSKLFAKARVCKKCEQET